jgi:hypothetical protein
MYPGIDKEWKGVMSFKETENSISIHVGGLINRPLSYPSETLQASGDFYLSKGSSLNRLLLDRLKGKKKNVIGYKIAALCLPSQRRPDEGENCSLRGEGSEGGYTSHIPNVLPTRHALALIGLYK